MESGRVAGRPTMACVTPSADGHSEAAFLQLLDADRLSDAADYCRGALEEGADRRYWLLQLAFVDIDRDVEDNDAYYNELSDVLGTLVREFPEDADAHFWFGYFRFLLPPFDEQEGMRACLRALELDPAHLYANIVVAGHLVPDEAEPYLRQALREQPANHRALVDLARALVTLGRDGEAKEALRTVLAVEPFVETRLAAGNGYANGAFNGCGSWHARNLAAVGQGLRDWELYRRRVLGRARCPERPCWPWSGRRRLP
jgi:tetratricopeptide (TPR) repeat protein